MTTTLSWLIENRIIYAHFSGIITLEELAEATQLGKEMINNATADIPLIHGIVDNREVTEFPQSMFEVNGILGNFLKLQRLGWILYVTDMHPILKMMSSLVAQVSRTRYRSYATMDEALDFLAYVDTNLPDLSTIDLSQLEAIHKIEAHD